MKIYINSFAFAPTTLQDVFATSESTHVTIVCITTFVNLEFVFVPGFVLAVPVPGFVLAVPIPAEPETKLSLLSLVKESESEIKATSY